MFQAIAGVIFHCIGGFASGSFYLPFKRVRGWAWESYWLAGGIFSWLMAPLVAAYLTVPGFASIISGADKATLGYTYLMGLLWGVGGLTFGLSMRYLGMSLGMSIALGFCSAFGALLPSVYYDFYPAVDKTSFSQMVQTASGLTVLLSVLVCLIGIGICGYAGMRKEKEMAAGTQDQTVQEFNFSKGLMVAIVSGILSACFSFGIEAGKPMAEVALKQAEASGSSTLFVNNVVFVVILLGGLTTNLLWCLYLGMKNRSLRNYTDASKPLANNYLFSALAGITWFLQFFFYGMGETKLGNGASSWILHMASIIIVSNLWGIKTGEWKGSSPATFRTLLVGVGVILLSVVLGGLAKLLETPAV